MDFNPTRFNNLTYFYDLAEKQNLKINIHM